MTESLKVEVNGKWFVVEVEDLTTDPVRTLVDGHVVDVSLSSIESEQSEARTSPTALSQASAPAPKPVASNNRPAANAVLHSSTTVCANGKWVTLSDQDVHRSHARHYPVPSGHGGRSGCHRRHGLHFGGHEDATVFAGRLVWNSQNGVRRGG